MPGLQPGFSQAVEPNECDTKGNRVRPKKVICEALANDESEEDTKEEESGEAAPEESEEGRVIRGQKPVYKPSKEEWDNHMRTHIPYRKWCPHCVGGKRKIGQHGCIKDDLEESEGAPVISFDYMQMKTKEGKEE